MGYIWFFLHGWTYVLRGLEVPTRKGHLRADLRSHHVAVYCDPKRMTHHYYKGYPRR